MTRPDLAAVLDRLGALGADDEHVRIRSQAQRGAKARRAAGGGQQREAGDA